MYLANPFHLPQYTPGMPLVSGDTLHTPSCSMIGRLHVSITHRHAPGRVSQWRHITHSILQHERRASRINYTQACPWSCHWHHGSVTHQACPWPTLPLLHTRHAQHVRSSRHAPGQPLIHLSITAVIGASMASFIIYTPLT